MRIYRQTAFLSPDWYNETVAQQTTDPTILQKILQLGNEDEVSQFAVQNPNCPPELIIDIVATRLNNKPSSVVASCAVSNVNCPEQAFELAIANGNLNAIAVSAVKNLRFPQRLFYEVLEKARGRDFWLYEEAIKNPNCPQELIDEWKEAHKRVEKTYEKMKAQDKWLNKKLRNMEDYN